MAGAAIGQVIPVHRGDHGEPQAEACHGLGHPLRLLGIQLAGAPLAHVAEPAVSRADVAHEHEGGGAVDAPALMEVRAAGLFTDRHQPLLPDEPFDLRHHLRRRHADLQPFRSGAGEDRGTGHGLPLSPAVAPLRPNN